MNVVLWSTAGLLATVFSVAGLLKLATPQATLATQLAWTEDYTARQVKTIGALELLGAVGLLIPAALGVAQLLTPLAATGLAITMLFAAVVHARREEWRFLPLNVVLGGLAVFLAIMRSGPYAF